MPPMQAFPNITVPSILGGSGGAPQPPILTITNGGHVTWEDASIATGFSLDTFDKQVFNGYVQQSSGAIKTGDNLAGLGIVIKGNSPTLQNSTSFTGYVNLWRDWAGGSAVEIAVNTGKVEDASTGSVQILSISQTSIRLKFNSFPVIRKTGGGLLGTETLQVDGTVEFTNVP
ncbi:hypothetical protein [Armatimonas sp.]|uniref:hypothetical protein n=1 Tax=Armatimonas sp. TaxID=1872638 RepID=UPI00374CE1CB